MKFGNFLSRRARLRTTSELRMSKVAKNQGLHFFLLQYYHLISIMSEYLTSRKEYWSDKLTTLYAYIIQKNFKKNYFRVALSKINLIARRLCLYISFPFFFSGFACKGEISLTAETGSR